MSKLQNLLKIVPNFITLALAFLMPLFFLSTTSEFYEFNKWSLLLISSLLLLVLTGVNIIVTRRFAISKSSLDLPLIVFISVVILSTIFSVHKPSSIFGSYGRWFPSLMGMLTVLVYYYLSTPHLTTHEIIRKVLYAFLIGSTVSTIVALLSYFRIYIGESQFMQLPNFSLTGSITTTTVLAALAAVLAFSLLVNAENVVKKALLTASILLNLLFISLVNLPIGWILLVVGVILALLSTTTQKIQKNKFDLLVIAGGVLALVVVILYPDTRKVIVNNNYPKELSLTVQESWISASSGMRDFPLLGSGPSTFYLNFPRYKSLQFNNTDFWNVRFDKPYNEFFNILGTMGIIGIIAASFLGIRTFKYAFTFKKDGVDDSGDTVTIRIALILALATFILTYATVLNTFVFFLFLSLLVAKQNVGNQESVEDMMTSLSSLALLSNTPVGAEQKNSAYAPYIVAAPLFIATILAGWQFYKVYAAEYFTRLGITATQNNDGSGAFLYQGRAINTNPQIDAYHTVYAQTNLALANSLAGNENLSDTDRQNIQALIAQAIRSIRISTEVLSPLNVNNWEVRAGIYRSLIGVADNAEEWAVSSYNTAIQLDPTNPRLRVNLGGVYYLAQDYLSAANQFRQAIILKGDYANAYYNFAQALALLKDYDNARIALETTQRLVPADSPDADLVAKDLETLASMAAAAPEEDARPSIESLSQPGPTQTVQEPLTRPEQQTQPQQP